MNKISGIYRIRSLCNPERIYIGSTVDIYYRWANHLSNLRNNKHHSRKLQHHYNKHGERDLVFEVLLTCKTTELIKNEQLFIDTLNPWFNNCPIAGTTLGRRLSKTTRNKMSKTRTGKHHSEETRKKMSQSGKIRIISDKAKKNMSNAKSGKNNPMHNKQTHNSRLVINLETGIFYDSIYKAALSININPTTLYAYMSGRIKNKTKFALV